MDQIAIWAIYIIHYGVKMYVTKIDGVKHIHEFAKTKCSSKDVLKFGRDEAIRIIEANSKGRFHTYGITATNGSEMVVSQSIYKKAKNRNLSVDAYNRGYGPKVKDWRRENDPDFGPRNPEPDSAGSRMLNSSEGI